MLSDRNSTQNLQFFNYDRLDISSVWRTHHPNNYCHRIHIESLILFSISESNVLIHWTSSQYKRKVFLGKTHYHGPQISNDVIIPPHLTSRESHAIYIIHDQVSVTDRPPKPILTQAGEGSARSLELFIHTQSQRTNHQRVSFIL
jgi:hypothetical protein